MNNWKDEAGDWHNDFNAVAWAAEINGRQMKYEKNTKRQEEAVKSTLDNQYNYSYQAFATY